MTDNRGFFTKGVEMKKPAYLEVNIVRKAFGMAALPLLVVFIYLSVQHHTTTEKQKFRDMSLTMQIDRAWAISYLNTGKIK